MSQRAPSSDYLALRRALGFKLEQAGRLLRISPATLNRRGRHGHDRPGGGVGDPAQPVTRCGLRAADRGPRVRPLPAAVDPAAEIPPAGPAARPDPPRHALPLLRRGDRRADDRRRMLRSPLRAATFQTLIGLLAVTGMRVGEAIALDRGDLDATAGLLTVRNTKFGKSRQLPLHPTTAAGAGRLPGRARRALPAPATSALLVSTTGARLRYATVQPRRSATCCARQGSARLGGRRAHHPRPAPLLRGQHPARLVPRRRRRRRPGCRSCPPTSATSTPAATYWYLSGRPRAARPGRRAARGCLDGGRS